MSKYRNFIEYFLFLIKKLGYLAISTIILNLIIIFFINWLLYKLPLGIPLFIVIIPIITFFISFVINQLRPNFENNISHYKYSFYFPFVFFNDSSPKRSKRINMSEIRKKIKPGDVLLRRYNRYIDGLIFSENSYFTHAGIYCSEFKGITDQVLHSEAALGVHETSLEQFCNCDDLAILRFSFEKSEQEIDMLKNIKNEHRPTDDPDRIKYREELVFNKLIDQTKSKKISSLLQQNGLYVEGFSDIILDRAISLRKTPYDLKFDFTNFDCLSCIEYVWYCFKSLYPLHRISVNDFEFFQIIKIPVIVPDVFIRNDFFHFVYSSVPGTNSNKDLIKYAAPDHWQFWKFIGMIVLWDIAFLYISYLVFHTYF